ncbi:MAG TPA: Rieske 2Fe-2S domain-containing protein [Chloroflexota bacterium]|nr:Rieske 2Fe-2S domain-containing protein [Chloroflexota bacterium]
MLSKEENELITRAGPGTPMGNLMRRYWIPALLTEEIPTPDSPPVQVRILGEELVAFRDTNGRIGLLDEHCHHRGTSLFYGRNEECGLRCVYHGWKYDVEGHVVDTPAEPAGSRFKEKLRHPAYPTHEVAGIIFAYLGPRERMPLFPNYDWTQVPTDHTYVTKAYQSCNYLQGLEGECDSSHLSFLHRTFSRDGDQSLYQSDSAPAYETEEADFGMRLIATRKAGPGKRYVRVSAQIMPVGVAVPVGTRDASGNLDGYEVHFYTPIDDTHSWRFDFGFRRSRVVTDADVHRRLVIGPDYRRIPNADNHYLQDREMQRAVNFTGMTDFLTHDSCATESMGPLFDRSREHLGASDKGVIAVRRYLLDAIKALQDGREPPHLVRDFERNDFRHANATYGVIEDDGSDWHGHFPHMALTAEDLTAERGLAEQRAG